MGIMPFCFPRPIITVVLDLITHHGPQRNAYYRQDLSGNPFRTPFHPQRYERLPRTMNVAMIGRTTRLTISSSINEHALHAFDLPAPSKEPTMGMTVMRYPAQYLTRNTRQRFRRCCNT